MRLLYIRNLFTPGVAGWGEFSLGFPGDIVTGGKKVS